MGRVIFQPVDPASYVPHARADDPRLAHHAKSLRDVTACGSGDIVLLGVPDDRGVAINRGRPGAAAGPAAFREAFYRLTIGPQRELAALTVWDGGDVMPGASNVETHARIAELVEACCRRGALPIVIGGGHDNTYGGVRGARGVGSLGLINIDAHLDLRPNEPDGQVGSGTPFRRLIDDGIIRGDQLIEFGYQPHAASPAHVEYARAHGVRLWSWADRSPEPVRLFAQMLQHCRQTDARVAISCDLDAIVASAAPGVSAPAVLGFTPHEALGFMQLAGADGSLCYCDMMELNPAYDVDGRTARLAATLVWHLLIGRTQL